MVIIIIITAVNVNVNINVNVINIITSISAAVIIYNVLIKNNNK